MDQTTDVPTTATDEKAGSETGVPIPGRFSLFSKLILCLVLVLAADVIFYDAPLGWMSGVVLLTLGGMIMVVHGGEHDDLLRWSAMAWLVGMSLSLVVSITPLSLILGMGSLLSVYSLRRFSRTDHAFSFLGSMSWDAIQIPVSPGMDSYAIIKVASRNKTKDRGGVAQLMQWFVEWLIPAGLFVTFVVLFSLANPIFSSVFSPLRILFWIMIGGLVWGLLRRPRSAPPSTESMLAVRMPRMSLNAVTRSLLVFNLLFLIQNGLDVMYLWGGQTLPEGMTYAEYAHRGAYPLVATALLAAVFVLISFRGGEKRNRMNWARWLVYAWIIQNIFLLGSAAWRLWIYVDFYGLTRWRVATGLWMVLVALGLGYILIRIVGGYSNRWLINVNAATAIVLLSACTFVNMDRFIADYNVAHCKEVRGTGVPIDVSYLGELGVDALPAVNQLHQEIEDARKKQRLEDLQKKFTGQLIHTLDDWRGFTFQRSRLLEDH